MLWHTSRGSSHLPTTRCFPTQAASKTRGCDNAPSNAGNIGSWPQDGVRLVGYWIGKEHWGKGVATRTLAAFLHLVTEGPLHAHVAKHNVGSIRVLEKCGFRLEREESVEVAGKDVAELVLALR